MQVFPNGSTSVFASGFAAAIGLETGIGDYLFIGNSGNGTISRIDSTGFSETYLSGFGGPGGPFGLSFDESENLYFVQHGTGEIHKSTPDKTVTTLANLTDLGPTFIRVGPSTDVYVSDSLNAKIFKISGNDVTVFASDFTGKSNAPVIGPSGLYFNNYGDLYVGDGQYIWKFSYKTPLQKIEEILIFFDESVADGTIFGHDRDPCLADYSLRSMREMLETAKCLLEAEGIKDAFNMLKSALKHCDGEPKPTDSVEGEAVSELAEMIEALMENLEWE